MIIGYIYRETPSQNQSWGVITRGVGDAKMRRHFGPGWAQHASQGFSWELFPGLREEATT